MPRTNSYILPCNSSRSYASSSMTILDTLDVHAGVRGPSHWDEMAALRRVTAVDADDDGDRPVVTLPDIDWAGLGFTPRWVGDDPSESVAAVEPLG